VTTQHTTVTIEWSPTPAWPWILRAADGTAFKKFRSHEAMTAWLVKHEAEHVATQN
jgi:hypothetical protein